jgi:hypothetical protein
MKRLLTVLTVLLVHTAAAHAQQSDPATIPAPGEVPPPPPQGLPPAAPQEPPPGAVQELPPAYAPPPGYAPPPTYGAPPAYSAQPTYPPPAYPPPGYGAPAYRYAPSYRYAPPSYYAYPSAPPPRNVLDRPFTLGGGIGFGGLVFNDQNDGSKTHEGGLSYTFRLGFGLCPGLLLLWDVEGAVASHGASTVSQTANLAALQLFVTRRLFLKGGFGIADGTQGNFPTQWGAAAMGGVGLELVQGWNWSFDIEATVTGAHLNSNGDDQTWTNWSLVNFALNFF